MSKKQDAWKQMDDLWRRYRKSWKPRDDLRITANGCDRTVTFALGYEKDRINGVPRFHYTTRNVGTMRELAEALLAACDFVETANPEWAKHLQT